MFFSVTVGLLALFVLSGVAATLLLVLQAESINRQGGWGWILVAGVAVLAATVVFSACGLCAAASLLRGEAHRRASIAILVISCLVVSAFAPNVLRTVNALRQQRAEAPPPSQRPSSPPAAPAPTVMNHGSSAAQIREVENPQIVDLKARLWEAIRTKNADAFVDCFYIEERFNTTDTREWNRSQMEILLQDETTDIEVGQIPARELAEMMKIQSARGGGSARYSLTPRMMLRVRQEGRNGRAGRNFLIGERNGKWYIITMVGRTT